MSETIDDAYSSYENISLERRGAIIQITLHTDGDSLVWNRTVHDDLPRLFAEVSNDRRNKVAILTGTGDAFCDELDATNLRVENGQDWESIRFEGTKLIGSLLDVGVPVIGAVNGPARCHAEIPILSDVVLASETAVFQDTHFLRGSVPGDGVHVVWTHVLGPNRGRYFLSTGQELDAATALAVGAVGEVLRADALLPRAWSIAETIAAQPYLTCRYSREVFTYEYKRLMHSAIGLGLSLQGLARLDSRSSYDAG